MAETGRAAKTRTLKAAWQHQGLIYRLARIAVMLVAGLVLYVKFFENRLIFYPSRELQGSPRIPFENVHFSAGDGTRLHGWFIPFKESTDITIISHGNAGNIGDRYEMGEFVHRLFHTNVLMYDYRGYGLSEGTPSEAGLYSDLRGGLEFVRSRGYEAKHIFLIGQSLGTAVTVEVATRGPVAGIVLEAPFTSVADVARNVTQVPIGFLFRTRFDSLSRIVDVQTPIVVVHGRRDPVIPYDQGLRLFNAIRGPKKMFSVDGAHHEGVLMELPADALAEIRRFLKIPL